MQILAPQADNFKTGAAHSQCVIKRGPVDSSLCLLLLPLHVPRHLVILYADL
jgi:hypothetical protein